MNDASQTIAALKANSNKFTQTNIRSVIGGCVITGQIQYQDKDTKGVVLTDNAEGVAANIAVAHQMSANYHTYGNFEGVDPAAANQANLFGTTPATV